MEFPRGAGILLHPTSLPARYGIGDFGPEAYAFANFLIDAGQSLWQMLPLGPTDNGNSPYSSYSAFAGNTLLISPEQLVLDGLLTTDELPTTSILPEEQIDFRSVRASKAAMLKVAYTHYQESVDTSLRAEFESFNKDHKHWLDNYALFRSLKTARSGAAWHEWEPSLVNREPPALIRAGADLEEQINEVKFYQFLFFRQWKALKKYCNERGIDLMGDIPIFVAHDSVDVWANADQFKLTSDNLPAVVAGVPPDYFSATGQFWGNPIYDWDRMSEDGFKWWVTRMRAAFQMYDIVRIDHFRGFAACWEIPAEAETAEDGSWVTVPGDEVFAAIKTALGELPIIAEDLGVITGEVDQLRGKFNFPGMRVLQFAFSGDEENIHLPHNYPANVVAYTGTHDNDTAVGWFNRVPVAGSLSTADEIESERNFCKEYLKTNGEEIHWDFIQAVSASNANTAIVPLQDVLGLGSHTRMNLPNSVDGNWLWRMKADALTDEIVTKLGSITEVHGRRLGEP
ncbi:MAG TPA: 4-alpha-glucanotransferase [Pyrinomonadaceae bacterium]|nr:4-alpha-glucanotransferase [Pyrinomonadaceae bacterium]